MTSSPRSKIPRGVRLREIAASTIRQLERGSYTLEDITHDLTSAMEYSKKHASFYTADSELSNWRCEPSNVSDATAPLQVSVQEISTLEGCRLLSKSLISRAVSDKRIGVLNFASAKNPGGGFLNGAQAQEESLARSSSLYPSLMTEVAQQFYRSHKTNPRQGYYSHAMIYVPRVILLRDDDGEWKKPLEVDVIVSAAVNAGVVRRELRKVDSSDEGGIEIAMTERMARILFLFERNGIRNLILGSFGTGVFRNNVDLVAGIWEKLLVGEGARFSKSFNTVLFAILGNTTFKVFQSTFSNVQHNLG